MEFLTKIDNSLRNEANITIRSKIGKQVHFCCVDLISLSCICILSPSFFLICLSHLSFSSSLHPLTLFVSLPIFVSHSFPFLFLSFFILFSLPPFYFHLTSMSFFPSLFSPYFFSPYSMLTCLFLLPSLILSLSLTRSLSLRLSLLH